MSDQTDELSYEARVFKVAVRVRAQRRESVTDKELIKSLSDAEVNESRTPPVDRHDVNIMLKALDSIEQRWNDITNDAEYPDGA